MKFILIVALLFILIGFDAEFISYAYYGGLLKGSVLSIMLITTGILAVNFACFKAFIYIFKRKF